MALTPKQHRFAEEYLIDLNATQAAIRAGYSRHTSYSIGHDLLKEPEVAALVGQLMSARSKRTCVDAAWVLERLRDEVEADMADLYDETGALLPLDDWPIVWRTGLITGIETEEIEVNGVRMGTVRKIKQSDRIKRLELIGRHVGVQAFKDVVDVSVTDGLADRVQRAKDRGIAAAAEKAAAVLKAGT
jgi:phage terminase small subunit